MQSCNKLKYEEMMGSIRDGDERKSSCKGPKGGIGKAVMRRRSRASKMTPTTLLKADAGNFRALVQQFTGCHTATPLLPAYKGPINLNFKHSTYYPQNQQPQEEISHDDHGFPSAGAKNNVAAAAAHDDDHELFVSQDRQNPRSADDDALTHHPSGVVDDFWGQLMSASAGDHYSTGLINREFWG